MAKKIASDFLWCSRGGAFNRATTMTWALKWHPNAYKNLKKLSQDIIVRVFNRLDLVKEQPFRFLEHYEGAKVYKLRIGEYRVLIDIDLQNQLLLIRAFDHRSKIYDRFQGR